MKVTAEEMEIFIFGDQERRKEFYKWRKGRGRFLQSLREGYAYTTYEAAQVLGVTTGTIYKLRKEIKDQIQSQTRSLFTKEDILNMDKFLKV